MLTTSNDDSDLLKKVITGIRWLYPLSKTEDADERKAFCYDWGDKGKIVTGAVGDMKKHVSEVFRVLETYAGISVLYRQGGYFEGDKIVVIDI